MKENDNIAKGYKSLIGGKAWMQSKTDAANDRGAPKWVESKMSHRVLIALKGKEKKPMFVYSNDLDACKALIVRVKLMANPELAERL